MPYLPYSYTHIEGECKAHKNLTIGRHNAACQLVHAAICNFAKGGGALYSAKDLVVLDADVGTQPQTTEEDLEGVPTLIQNIDDPTNGIQSETDDLLTPFTPEKARRHRRHTDVSQDPR